MAFLFYYLFIYLFLFFGCVGSSFPREASLQLWRAGATPHRGARASHRCGLSLPRSTGSRRAGSVVVAHGPSCSAARGILPDQGSNPCPLHWQADSQPLRHQGSPKESIFDEDFCGYFRYCQCSHGAFLPPSLCAYRLFCPCLPCFDLK